MKRAALVGCGNIAGVHATAIKHLENVELVAFADIIRERAEGFSKKYTDGKAKAYGSLDEMLESEAPDVLHICTPHYLHVPMAIEALKRGVSVFSEKPPAINMEQFACLEKAAEAAGNSSARLGFCFQNRYNKTTEKTDEILKSGSMGHVKGARAFVTWRRDEEYYRTDWKGKIETEGGGALINQSIHTLDLLLRYLGRPVDVEATVSNHHLKGIIEVEDTLEAWMSFENGERACFYASTGYVADAPVILELQCEKGSITIIDRDITVRNEQGIREYRNLINNEISFDGVGKDYWGKSHYVCIRDFYDKLETGERYENDLDGVKNTMETVMRIYGFRERINMHMNYP